MALDTAVNSQITDAVTQTNVKVLGESPAQALSLVYQTMSHSLELSVQNATESQRQLESISQAITAQCVNVIHSTNTVAQDPTK